MRLFIAIDLTDNLRKSLSEQMDGLKNSLGDTGIRWVKPSGIHLTLKFLGETPDHKLDEIRNSLKDIATQFAPFEFSIGSFGCFPNPRKPRVFWVGIQDPEGMLARIQHEIEMEFQKIGFASENRPFKAHLTLGRVKKQRSKDEFLTLKRKIEAVHIGKIGVEKAKEISLIRSVLKPTGAEYFMMGSYPFMEKE